MKLFLTRLVTARARHPDPRYNNSKNTWEARAGTKCPHAIFTVTRLSSSLCAAHTLDAAEGGFGVLIKLKNGKVSAFGPPHPTHFIHSLLHCYSLLFTGTTTTLVPVFRNNGPHPIRMCAPLGTPPPSLILCVPLSKLSLSLPPRGRRINHVLVCESSSV